MKQEDMIKDMPKLERIKNDEIYKEIYHNSPVMCRTINRNGMIMLCNKTCAEKLGYTIDEIIGTSDCHKTSQNLANFLLVDRRFMCPV